MSKVTIKICSGTSCFVMGASSIQALEFSLPEDSDGNVELVEFRCMNFCNDIKTKNNHEYGSASCRE